MAAGLRQAGLSRTGTWTGRYGSRRSGSATGTARELVEAVGLLRDDAGAGDDPDDPYTMVRTGYDAIVEELGTGWNSAADCETAIELASLAPDDARWALTCLGTLQVFDRDGTRLRVEPVLHSADPDDVTLRPDEYPDYGPAEFLDQRGGRAPGTRGSGRPIGMR
ncbi:hypothetical protein ACFP51_34960 [Streptomyces pratens]|uniref:Uncharacterized protein n=1 Tax=Streptomyces pratens TaxID=887456 RepID=A0ABW1M2N9_9ACTN|nr:hypothetical protein OHB56_35750 [Streptomyces sp. NBC_01635]